MQQVSECAERSGEERGGVDEDEKYIEPLTKLTLFSIFWPPPAHM